MQLRVNADELETLKKKRLFILDEIAALIANGEPA